MFTVTPDGYDMMNVLRTLTDHGVLSLEEFEKNMVVMHKRFAETSDKSCDYSYGSGCRPAAWRYLDEYSTVGNVMWGYLCANCARRESAYIRGIKLLEPLEEGVYDPDIELVYTSLSRARVASMVSQ